VVYVTQPPVETITTGAPVATVENTANNPAGASSGAPSGVSSEGNESGGRTINDLGPSYYADALPSAENGSLGELSAHYKALKAAVNARVLTNEDVQQMVSSKNGVTMAKNMPPLGQGSLEQSGQAQEAGSQSATQNAQSTQQPSQTSSPANQQEQNAANRQGGTPPPASSGKDQSAGTGVNAENSTTPQINQNQQSNDAQGSRRLPATATILPLLGLLGLVSGGIGFWFRKFRN
jgi:cobalamin biosynthesis Mg chelatase CobN